MKFACSILLVLTALAAAPTFGADIAHGDKLFRSFCVPCHGFPPSGGAEFGADNPNRIRGAIGGNVPAMVFLRTVLSNADIDDIAAYLGSLNAPPPPATIVPAFNFSDLWYD